jgi:hypothetical protein
MRGLRSPLWVGVEGVGGSMKALGLVTGWKGSLEQQGAHDIIGGMNHVLDLAILWGSVGT